MRVSELGRIILACHEDYAPAVVRAFSVKEVRHIGKLCLYDLDRDVTDEQRVVITRSGLWIRRYLDRFYLCGSLVNLRHNQGLVDRFFEVIAAEYEQLIDVSRNLDNIRNLLNFIRQLQGEIRGEILLDYGCGTGLSIAIGRELGVGITGMDRCASMRRRASARGMTTWSPGDLARAARESLTSAFASYVLHLATNPQGLRLLWARLRPGAVFVANFHKGVGIDAAHASLEPLGALIRRLPSPQGADRHGPYVAYVKKP
jgi:hypothetical protein